MILPAAIAGAILLAGIVMVVAYFRPAPEKAPKRAKTQATLAQRDDCILTPHNAFNTAEAVYRKSEHSVEQLVAWQKARSSPTGLFFSPSRPVGLRPRFPPPLPSHICAPRPTLRAGLFPPMRV